ncbi:hypothetical protein LCGC14_0055270 [marine sediment metagenome]|uniref:Uncharacterized protein n=1 Tax=marine sediment metagenome TaxID=412755 RepID=A0A0F9VR41_9ZZZZ
MLVGLALDRLILGALRKFRESLCMAQCGRVRRYHYAI